MPRNYRSELFATYDRRISSLDQDEPARISWFREYVSRYYLPALRELDRAASVLDIGCSRGYLLAALRSHGYTNLTGIDVSPGDVEHAKRVLPDATFAVADATSFLAARPGAFNVIVMKAVLEHIPKDEVLAWLAAIGGSLTTSGVAIIDVPNMDWLFSGHERYMDFTHECGFTRESLEQVLGTTFADVVITPADNNLRAGSGLRARASRTRIRLGRKILGTLLRWSDPDGAASPIWARSLVAIARSPRGS